MTVSLCVIAYNEEKVISDLFNNIIDQNYPHNKMEIVLVDSGSSDQTKLLMQNFAETDHGFLRVKICDNPKKKQAAGWNIAIKEARCDIILRVDAHAVIPFDFVTKNVECIKNGEFVSGGKRPNIPDNDSAWSNTLQLVEKSMFGSSFASYRSSNKKGYVKSIFHGAYRKEVFERTGLFNENLGRTEDNEMHYRIIKAGYKICYSPQIISYQRTRSSFRKLMKQKFGNGYWVGLTVGACRGCLSYFHFVPLCFVLCLSVCLGLAFFGFPIPLIILGSVYLLTNLIMSASAIITENRFNILYLTIPFIFLCLHLSYGVGTMIGILEMPFWLKKYKKQQI
ncbi:MAG: glycosyltransferase family 2 protein [Acutalibacteraceae bacterium]|nr:glycosyltransferase family 2 protein [Acutalibacteraceae bacterium]